jgi:hypothetical protein
VTRPDFDLSISYAYFGALIEACGKARLICKWYGDGILDKGDVASLRAKLDAVQAHADALHARLAEFNAKESK